MNETQRLESLESDVEKLSSKIDDINEKIMLMIEAINNAKLDAINKQTTYIKRSSGVLD